MKKLHKKSSRKTVAAFGGLFAKCNCKNVRCMVPKGQGGGSAGDAAMNSFQSNDTKYNS